MDIAKNMVVVVVVVVDVVAVVVVVVVVFVVVFIDILVHAIHGFDLPYRANRNLGSGGLRGLRGQKCQ